MDEINFRAFSMKTPELNAKQIQAYLKTKTFVGLDHFQADALMQDMAEWIAAAWMHGYDDGEIAAGSIWDPNED